MENILLTRKYYEYDNAFFSMNANVSCVEQMQYQSLREYNIDFFLVFCNDINITLEKKYSDWSIKPNNLNYNSDLFHYVSVATSANKVEKAIEQIINSGKVVVFQTAFDYLHTSVWFHEKGSYTRTSHNAIIVGYDNKFFFYVDSPPMRNPKYFIAHPDNLAVGCIDRSELMKAFLIHCRIGYITINESKLSRIADIRHILTGIKRNYLMSSQDGFLGKEALEKFSQFLIAGDETEGLFKDPFAFDLVASRHKKLLLNVIKYEYLLKSGMSASLVKILNDLVNNWRLVENLVIKYSINMNDSIVKSIFNILYDNIIPFTDTFMACLEDI